MNDVIENRDSEKFECLEYRVYCERKIESFY